MAATALFLLAFVGLVLLGTMAVAQRRHLRDSPSRTRGALRVSVLKPLKGLDAELESNLASWFESDYPAFEILLGVRDGDDPAVAVARRVAAAHPEIPSRIVVDRRTIGENPKVNNLANLYQHAAGEAILIADSNVRVGRGVIGDLVARFETSGAGVVSAPIRGIGDATLGSRIESLQLNTFVMGGVCAAHRLAGRVCVVGKAMMVRREALDAIGGFAHLSRFLAEDQICGEEVAASGRRVVVSAAPVDNVVGPISVRDFVARHLRWARIRSRMDLLAYCGEVVLHPAPFALVAAALSPSAVLAALALAVVVAESLVAASAERTLGVARPAAAYPVLVVLRDTLVLAVWAVPLFSRTVRWRGTTYRIGVRTRLEPVPRRAGRVPDAVATSAA